MKVESKLPQNAREKLGKAAPKPKAEVVQKTINPADLEKPQMKGGYSSASKQV